MSHPYIGSIHIQRLQLIYQPELWQAYQSRKRELKVALQSQGLSRPLQDVRFHAPQTNGLPVLDPEVGEVWLYHGASLRNIQSILKYGFQPERFCRYEYVLKIIPRGYGPLGRGTYLTDNFSKSATYVNSTVTNPEESRYILICRVLLGRPLLNTKKDRKTQDNTDLRRQGFHSVYGAAHSLNSQSSFDCNEFCLYDGAQIYPEYLIEYTLNPPRHPDPPVRLPAAHTVIDKTLSKQFERYRQNSAYASLAQRTDELEKCRDALLQRLSSATPAQFPSFLSWFEKAEQESAQLAGQPAPGFLTPDTPTQELALTEPEKTLLKQSSKWASAPKLFPYLPPRVVAVQNQETLFWHQAVTAFLEDRSKTILVLQGEPEAGKTTCLDIIQKAFASRNSKALPWQVEKRDLVFYTPDTLLEGLQTGLKKPLLLLLDNYDDQRFPALKEMYPYLSQAVRVSLKLVVTCQGLNNGWINYQLRPFDSDTIRAYLRLATRSSRPLPPVLGEEPTPLLLSFLPHSDADAPNLLTLFRRVIQHWLDNAVAAEHHPLVETWFKQLALKLHQTPVLSVEALQTLPHNAFVMDCLINKPCPFLSLQQNQLRFKHQRLQAYWLSLALWQGLTHSVHLTPEWSQVSPTKLLHDASLVGFLRDLAKAFPEPPKQFVNLITRTREDRSDPAAHLAALTATLLNAIDFDFRGLDFTGCRLPQTDLRGARLAQTRFIGMDLTRASWRQPRGAPLTGHTDSVWCLAFSPDGRTLASGSYDHTLRLWDPTTGQPRGAPLKGHTNWVWCLAFSPDGRTLASGSDDHTLRLWDPATGQPRSAPLTGHTNGVTCLAFSPDGRTLASGSHDNTLRLWDSATGQPRGVRLTGHTGWVRCLAFSPDGRTLASGSYDHTLRLWDPTTGQPRGAPLKGHTNWVWCLAFSPDGRTLASGSDDHTLRLWDPATGQPRSAPLTGHTNWVWCLAFSPDGRTLASGSHDNTLRLWDSATGQPRGVRLTGHTGWVRCLAFSPPMVAPSPRAVTTTPCASGTPPRANLAARLSPGIRTG